MSDTTCGYCDLGSRLVVRKVVGMDTMGDRSVVDPHIGRRVHALSIRQPDVRLAPCGVVRAAVPGSWSGLVRSRGNQVSKW